MSKLFTFSMALSAVLVVLGGCATAGKDFPRPTAETAVIGQTTKEQVRQTFGAPREEQAYRSSSPTEGAPSGAEYPAAANTRFWYFFGNPKWPEHLVKWIEETLIQVGDLRVHLSPPRSGTDDVTVAYVDGHFSVQQTDA